MENTRINLCEKFEYLNPDTIYKCPLCHDDVKGKRGLTMHLRKKHFTKNVSQNKLKSAISKKDWSRKRFDPKIELKIQELVLKTVYGMSKVNSVVNDYINGKHTLKTLPINISYYIKLKGIKPDKNDNEKDVDRSDSNSKIDIPKKTNADNEDPILDADDLLDKLQQIPEEADEIVLGIKFGENGLQYVKDLIYNVSEKVLKLSTTNTNDDILKYDAALEYLENYLESEREEQLRNSSFRLDVQGKTIKRIFQKQVNEKVYVIMEVGRNFKKEQH